MGKAAIYTSSFTWNMLVAVYCTRSIWMPYCFGFTQRNKFWVGMISVLNNRVRSLSKTNVCMPFYVICLRCRILFREANWYNFGMGFLPIKDQAQYKKYIWYLILFKILIGHLLSDFDYQTTQVMLYVSGLGYEGCVFWVLHLMRDNLNMFINRGNPHFIKPLCKGSRVGLY